MLSLLPALLLLLPPPSAAIWRGLDLGLDLDFDVDLFLDLLFGPQEEGGRDTDDTSYYLGYKAQGANPPPS